MPRKKIKQSALHGGESGLSFFALFLKVKTCENTFIFRNTKRLQDLKNTSYAGIKSSKTDMSFFKKKALHYFYKDFTLIMYSLSARMQ